jgi:hypothetical protein
MDTSCALLVSTIVICPVVLDATRGIKRDFARIKCELTGHWHAEFKKYGDARLSTLSLGATGCRRCHFLSRFVRVWQ